MNNRELLTTGQAASICSVTRNTIFKWIQSGYLTARRTAGGHHRIDKRDLDRLMDTSGEVSSDTDKTSGRSGYQYCWEYNGNGKTQEACLDCAVYQLRALRCYEVAKLAPEAHHARLCCNQHCEDCDYYKEMHGKTANVLVVTKDQVLAGDLMAHADEARFNLEITDCEYNCSTIVNHFKPDFVIIDCNMGREVSRHMSNRIMEDPRIPYVRVVLAGSKDEFPRECEREVFARMTRPFNIPSITECIDTIGDNAKA
jgi:excisionase family DNA binding protein